LIPHYSNRRISLSARNCDLRVDLYCLSCC